MWDLGFTAFGGPPVHFQILHRRFVEGKGFGGGSKWIDEQTVSIYLLLLLLLLNQGGVWERDWSSELKEHGILGTKAMILRKTFDACLVFEVEVE
jgi:hypothetical protein